jgi:hypothetical protein
MYRSALDIRSSSNLRRKNSENKILLNSNFQETKERENKIAIKNTSQHSHNNPCESFNHGHFSIRGKPNGKGSCISLNKKSHVKLNK